MPIPPQVIASIVGGSAVLGGAGLSVAAGNASTRKQYKYQSRLQEQAARLNYEYGLKSLENSPSSTRFGLESAGYNPMLAVQNATSGANAGWTSSGQMSAPDYASNMASNVSAIQDIQRLTNETKQVDSQVKLNESQGRKAVAEAIAQEVTNPFIPKKEQAHLNQVSAATEKLIRETSFMDQLAENMIAGRRLQEMGIYADLYGRIYTANKGYDATVYNADTNKEIADAHAPSGRSASFENYTRGIGHILNGGGSLLHGYNETSNYNGSNESETVYYDKDGNVRGSVSHKGKNNGSSKKSRKHR